MANSERMISASKLVTRLAKRFRNRGMVHYDDLMAEIADVPTVDAVEVVHGRWVEIDHYPPECSICGDIAPLTCDGEAHYMGNYCPNCGAIMDEERR